MLSFQIIMFKICKKLKINNIVLNGNASANYFIDYQNLELFGSIYQKQLLVQIENQTKVYGETDKAFSYSVQGLIDTDNLQEKVTRNAGEKCWHILAWF